MLYWQLTQLGVACEVIAPSLVPTKAGDRVKTDRRDAEKLARCYRAGELTAVWVPDAAHEALRDLVRAREAAKKDQLRHRHRLGKFLLRHGKRPTDAGQAWTKKYVNGSGFTCASSSRRWRPRWPTIWRKWTTSPNGSAKLEQAIDEAMQQARAGNPGGDRSAAGVARRSTNDGRHHRERSWDRYRASRVRAN